MKISTAAEMRRMDQAAREQYAIPELLLMENAGRAVATVVDETLGGAAGKTVCILAGTGNNGGDALVAARWLTNLGADVKIVLLGETEKLTKSAAVVWKICQKMGLSMQTLTAERDWEKAALWLRLADGVVDGIVGTGVRGELRADAVRLLALTAECTAPIVSVDIPSGVNADTGAAAEHAIRAAVTVTFALPKVGHFFGTGARCTGRLVVDGISMPPALLEDRDILQTYLDLTAVRPLLPARNLDVHKGTCGRILAIVGSRALTGAACLATEAVLRAGAGIATLASAESLYPIFAAKLTEVMTQPLPEYAPGILGDAAHDPIVTIAGAYDALLIGPGLGRHAETEKLVRRIVKSAKKPLVLDADALHAFIGHTDELKAIDVPTILTPHLGELATLLGTTVEKLREDLLTAARKAAIDWGVILVVKSECTLIALPSGMAYFTSKGNAGMATAGAGDVLAGTIAGLLKQVATPEDAALLGVYLHGAAGDIAADTYGDGLMARDILDAIPAARKTLAES